MSISANSCQIIDTQMLLNWFNSRWLALTTGSKDKYIQSIQSSGCYAFKARGVMMLIEKSPKEALTVCGNLGARG